MTLNATILTLFLSTYLILQPPVVQWYSSVDYDCGRQVDIGRDIMRLAQSGVKKEELIQLFSNDSFKQKVVEAAYVEPLHLMLEDRVDAVERFGEVVLRVCVDKGFK